MILRTQEACMGWGYGREEAGVQRCSVEGSVPSRGNQGWKHEMEEPPVRPAQSRWKGQFKLQAHG